ncbi:MAG: hypothetical protein HWN79_17610 [Candidatus Lokiarchaeota archaeon]|nr:hypothetical protein [Candidatus Lokiarchaeota archaeon]
MKYKKPRQNHKSKAYVKREGSYAAKRPETKQRKENGICPKDLMIGFRNKVLTKKFGNHNNPWDRI